MDSEYVGFQKQFAAVSKFPQSSLFPGESSSGLNQTLASGPTAIVGPRNIKIDTLQLQAREACKPLQTLKP